MTSIKNEVKTENSLPVNKQTTDLSLLSLVSAIIGILILPIIMSTVAIAAGVINIGRADRGEASQYSKNQSKLGVALGIGGYVMWVLIVAAVAR